MCLKIPSFLKFGRRPAGQTRRILVIDDGEIERTFVSATLEKNGDTALAAANGEEGLRLAREQKPDLIILDLVMPGMNGHEVCQRLKDDPQTASIPVIFLTGSAKSRDPLECYAVGADYYLEKPIKGAMLLKQVDLTLKERQPEKEGP